MVLAVVVLDSKGAAALTRAGLADSKSYGSGKKAKQTRERLAVEVRKRALFVALEAVPVGEIDRRVRRSELNVLEREVATRLIESAPSVHRIVADGEKLFRPLQTKYPHLEALNNGESQHAAVAAASVIAKTRRDELFALVQKRYLAGFGSVNGGGYVNGATKKFLRAYADQHQCLPPEARLSWPHEYLRDILGHRLDEITQPEALPGNEPEPQAQLGLF
jgi:ribonuclease HII